MRNGRRSSHHLVHGILAAGLIALPLAGSADAVSHERERVPVTDPGELEAMGFSRDAANVYRLASRSHGLNETETDRGDFGSSYFGTGSGFTTAMPMSFQGTRSGFTYDNATGSDMYRTSAADRFADAQVDIPAGARIEFLRLWGYDTHATEDLVLFFIEVCQPMFESGDIVSTTLLFIKTSGSGGNASVTAPVDLDAAAGGCYYFLRARFGASTTTASGSTVRLQKARVQWFRQVSPAPPTATFNDVPTNHLFFRHIEALVSSGITTGCGAGNYCPGAPVTRGEMAVFLAKALGLYWGGINP